MTYVVGEDVGVCKCNNDPFNILWNVEFVVPPQVTHKLFIVIGI